jgi:hypothetical protein
MPRSLRAGVLTSAAQHGASVFKLSRGIPTVPDTIGDGCLQVSWS